jgi:1-acyl-sn-glycerol-3-phosphate acyltransferase
MSRPARLTPPDRPGPEPAPHARDGFDPVLTGRIFRLLSETVCRYFRVQVLGAENIPRGRALLVGCHSGVFAWDATCLIVAVHRATGRFTRNVGDRFFAGLGPAWRLLEATGAFIGERNAVEELLGRDELVLVFPGGAADMLRPIWRRYRLVPHSGLAPGRGGYVKAALRARSPIVPVAVVGAEEIHVLLGSLPPLARLLGVPFFPIVASLLPLPARLYIRFGAPIRLDAPPEAADDQRTVDRLNRAVQRKLQNLIDDTVRRRRGIYWSSLDGDPGS